MATLTLETTVVRERPKTIKPTAAKARGGGEVTTITFDASIVKGMMEKALASCAQKTGLKSRDQVLAAMRRGECPVCDQLRYHLAQGVAAYLGAVDGTVKSVYIYEPEYATSVDGTDLERPRRSPGISLIAWVSRKSAALSSLIASMSAALAQESQRLTCAEANALCYALDVNLADDNEVENRTGYGALIHSLYVHPVEIWRK